MGKAELSGDILTLYWSRVFEEIYFFSIVGMEERSCRGVEVEGVNELD